MRGRIRAAAPSDAGGVIEIYGPYCEESPVSFEIRRPTIDEMEERIAEQAAPAAGAEPEPATA